MIRKNGFTLVEILVVITVIGILASILVSLIDPNRQSQRANEAVVRSMTETMCYALKACGASEVDARRCNSWDDINVTYPPNPPEGSIFTLTESAATADATITISGAIPTLDGSALCEFQCVYNFSDATVMDLAQVGTNCIIE
ncbi:type II secretion system protein [Patescibacteria group bacterium]|nr:type II secretion system protein [Patescibacteria group bacterium]